MTALIDRTVSLRMKRLEGRGRRGLEKGSRETERD
jgi:hypothetical protein